MSILFRVNNCHSFSARAITVDMTNKLAKNTKDYPMYKSTGFLAKKYSVTWALPSMGL